MQSIDHILPLTTPVDALGKLGALVLKARQREGWTQAELSAKSGVPKTTISRLERTGLAATDALCKVLFALNMLEGTNDYLKEQLRLVAVPKTLFGAESDPRPIRRVRHRKEDK
jgi:transcriptional regulator with XRE-family HTH domain